MNEVVDGSVDLCQKKSNHCEKRCFTDKRTARIAEANWFKVVKVLQQFNSMSMIEEKKQNQ
jgi:predicted transglutaminase-like cysteine proteinase